MLDWGHQIDSHTIQNGLQDLNPGFHFDLAARIGQIHPFINDRQSVFYLGRHICSMDRGMVPEFKVWSVKDAIVPVPWSDADLEDASIQYQIVSKATPGYKDLYSDARHHRSKELTIMDDGKLARMYPVRTVKVRDIVIRVGWRHTFERIIMAKIEGASREQIAAKFNVDMWKMPIGSPEETFAQLVEE